MNRKTAFEYGGKLSYPSKMDVAAYGISAERCRVGSKLREVAGSTCEGCYALKGLFLQANVKKVMDENYAKIFHPLNTPALAALIRWQGEERFRMFMAGDVQGENHFLNVIQMALANPQTVIWMPTREVAIVRRYAHLIPDNLRVRLSAAMVDGPPPRDWKYTSTVVTVADDDTCPASVKGGSCADNECVRCWTDQGNVPYLLH